jgi:hypothetical protein
VCGVKFYFPHTHAHAYIGLTYRRNFQERLKEHLNNKPWLRDNPDAYNIRLGYHNKDSNERTIEVKIAEAEVALIDVFWETGIRNRKHDRPTTEIYLHNIGKKGPLPSEIYVNPFTSARA